MANALGKRKPTYRVHIFNCDGTCNLDEVKSLFEAVGKKVEIRIEVRKHIYELNKTTTLVEKTIPSLKMDYAVLMVHARDNCPSFDDNCYGKIYRALKERTGSDEKLLIVIGGDEKYESKQEEEKEFISNCVLKKIGLPHFQRELLDGRKSFMFSWNKKHRPIHEEAMMHFLDPRKRGQKFVCQEKTQAKNNPVTPNVPSRPTQETSVIPVDNKVANQGNVMEANASVDGTDSTSPQEFTELSRTTHPKGTVLLSTIMQNGAISYRSADVTVWKDGRKWRVSDNEARRLQQEWRSSPTAQLKLVVDDEGKVQVIVKDETTFLQRVWLSLSGFIWG